MRPGLRVPTLAAACALAWFPCVAGRGGEDAATAALSAAASASPSERDVESFNLCVGTQTFGVKYGFTTKTRLVETAQAIRDMGSSVIKFSMGRDTAGQYAIRLPDSIRSLTDLARDEPSVRAVLDMPFADYLIWSYSFAGDDLGHGLAPERRRAIYREIRDFVAYLLTKYDGSGKRFYLGHWEGDWWILGHTDPAEDPSPEAIRGLIDWLRVREEAIEAATREVPHRDVRVFQYVEVNLVEKARKGGVTIATQVLPHVDVDYVSYSAYDALEFAEPFSTDRLTRALDFLESKLPPKPSIPGRRVFLGEYGFPLEIVKTPSRQDAAARAVIRAGLEWGCPFILYWELYCNEVKAGKHRGFWLIDDQGVRQPIHATHARILGKGAEFVRSFRSRHGRVPTAEEYRAEAVRWVDPE